MLITPDNFLHQTPKTSNIRFTPRIGCKTPGQSVILMSSGSGGVKRTMTAVLQLCDSEPIGSSAAYTQVCNKKQNNDHVSEPLDKL